MKRFSPIFYIWMFCLSLVSVITWLTYNSGNFTETLAWGTATIFLTNLILYHLNVTKGENEKDSDILDE